MSHRAMQGQKEVDTIPKSVGIVGAGIIGLSCAIHLQRAGHRVEVFDFRDPGGGATFGNAGTIAVSEVLPLSRPATLRKVPRMLNDPVGPLVVRPSYLPHALPWFLRFLAACRASEVRRVSSALASLLINSSQDWQDIVRGTDGENLLLSRGRLKVYRTEQGLRNGSADIPRQQECGVIVHAIDVRTLREMEPALATTFVGAHFYPQTSHLKSPQRIAHALAEQITRSGGRIHKQQIASIKIIDKRPVLVDSNGVEIGYDRVIIAAGAWSRTLLRSLGADVPLDTERGYHVMMATPPVPLQRPITVADPGYSLVQMDDGLRLTSGVEFAGLSAPPDFRRIRLMASHAASIVHGLNNAPLSEWLGFRPSMPTSLPLIGPLPHQPHVILAFGHGHIGLTAGPTTGRLVANMIAGRVPFLDVQPFLPR